MKHKTYGFFQVPDPSSKATFLMSHRSDKPLTATYTSKRQSPRVGRPPPLTHHGVMLQRGYRDRITLSPVWEKKP